MIDGHTERDLKTQFRGTPDSSYGEERDFLDGRPLKCPLGYRLFCQPVSFHRVHVKFPLYRSFLVRVLSTCVVFGFYKISENILSRSTVRSKYYDLLPCTNRTNEVVIDVTPVIQWGGTGSVPSDTVKVLGTLVRPS